MRRALVVVATPVGVSAQWKYSNRSAGGADEDGFMVHECGFIQIS